MNNDEKTLYVKLAYQYYQNKEYKRAYELYVKLAEADPEDFNIFNMLGDTYMKEGLKNKAADAYADSMAILEKKGQNLKILKLAKKVMKSIPDDPRVKTRLKAALRNIMRDAERKAMNHEYAEAREMYESMMDFTSEELPVKAKLAELESDEAKFRAREQQTAERKTETRSGGAQNELIDKFDKMAQNYISAGDFDGAVETYITALKLAPGNNDLREKLHKVYFTIAQKSAGERVWDKIDSKPHDSLEEAKRTAMEERRSQILREEEERARRLMDEEERIQQEYELMEADIIQKAAAELKVKLDEAQKKEKLKEEEIQRIMKEQEEKKKELLEKIKREAIEKWKKQKEAIQGSAEAAVPASVPEFIPRPSFAAAPEGKPPAPPPQPAKPAEKPAETLKKALETEPDERVPKPSPPPEKPKPVKIDLPPMPVPDFPPPKPKASLMDTLKKAYQTPVLGQGKDLPETQKGAPTVFPSAFTKASASAKASADVPADKKAPENNPVPPADQKDELMDDTGEVERKVMKDEIVVNGETLDSLITTAYIYVNQRMFKEALHIHNKITEKFPNNEEAKQLAAEIAKRQG